MVIQVARERAHVQVGRDGKDPQVGGAAPRLDRDSAPEGSAESRPIGVDVDCSRRDAVQGIRPPGQVDVGRMVGQHGPVGGGERVVHDNRGRQRAGGLCGDPQDDDSRQQHVAQPRHSDTDLGAHVTFSVGYCFRTVDFRIILPCCVFSVTPIPWIYGISDETRGPLIKFIRPSSFSISPGRSAPAEHGNPVNLVNPVKNIQSC